MKATISITGINITITDAEDDGTGEVLAKLSEVLGAYITSVNDRNADEAKDQASERTGTEALDPNAHESTK